MPFQRRFRRPALQEIKLTDPLWSKRQETLVQVTLPSQYDRMEETGRLENFRRAGRGEQGGFQGLYFNDSDVYKWLEACAYALAIRPDARLRALADEVIGLVVAAAMPDGYLNTFFQLEHPDKRWQNLSMMHEMYCGGHLLEAAAAWQESLGDPRLLNVAKGFADHVMTRFGPDRERGYCGHEEFEYGLIRLARATGEGKYREYARWMVEARGHPDSPFARELSDPAALALSRAQLDMLQKDSRYDGEYAQDHAPIREHRQVVGHAVRAMYLYIAAADLADGQGDADLEEALRACWDNLTKRRMYVTGGIGASGRNEGFTFDYDLPNLTAYAETCAAVGLALWGQGLLEMTGESDYADVVERALYNGVLAGISVEGDRYFYDNPLESRSRHGRTPWFSCACCPPNVARLLGQVGTLAAGIGEDTLYLHQPLAMELDAPHARITVTGDFPWSGEATIRVSPKTDRSFGIALRIPEWADEIGLELPGSEQAAEYENGYAVYRRRWREGDEIRLDLGAEPKWIEADPRVVDDLGRVALTHGPLVYCAEDKDNGYAPQRAAVLLDAPVEARYDPDLLGGANVIEAQAVVTTEGFPDGLYAEAGTADREERALRYLPYHLWNHRGASDMQVWVRAL